MIYKPLRWGVSFYCTYISAEKMTAKQQIFWTLCFLTLHMIEAEKHMKRENSGILPAGGIIKKSQNMCDPSTGQIFHFCYQRQCQPTCENAHDVSACPYDNTAPCQSGCFCPDTTVWNGKTCIQPEQCRDCICTGSGDVHYKTFDETYYDFQGNCSYIATRVKKCKKQYRYQVLVTNVECGRAVTCTEAVTILYKKYVIHMKRGVANQIITTVDSIIITTFPLTNSWLILQKTAGEEVTVYIPDIQLEVTFHYWFHFTVKASREKYGDKMEGLCGNCNYDTADDYKNSNGTLSTIVNEFAMSWLVEEMPEGIDSGSDCKVVALPTCFSGAAEALCDKMLDFEIFGGCFEIIDPAPYIASCKFDVCYGGEHFLCDSIANYAKACRHQNMCVDWRMPDFCPFNCSQELTYNHCGGGCGDIACGKAFTCFSHPNEGCYCPPGQVLKNNKCIPDIDCKNCSCSGYNDVHYVQYDEQHFDFQGLGTYIGSRSSANIDGTFDFQILLNNVECLSGVSCTRGVAILFNNHKIVMFRNGSSVLVPFDRSNLKIETYLDGVLVTQFPLQLTWAMILTDMTTFSTVYIPDINLEVTLNDGDWGSFTIRLPSAIYSSNLEGLCGNCNQNPADDFKFDGTLVTDPTKFGNSWLVTGIEEPLEFKYIHKKNAGKPKVNPPVPADQDPCLLILNKAKFGECHLVLDPQVYVNSCQFDMSHAPLDIKDNCSGVESYAKACSVHAGINVNWRTHDFCPFNCTKDTIYSPFGNLCDKSCFNNNIFNDCKLEPAEGCYCPDGKVFNDGGLCIDVILCNDTSTTISTTESTTTEPSTIEIIPTTKSVHCKLTTIKNGDPTVESSTI